MWIRRRYDEIGNIIKCSPQNCAQIEKSAMNKMVRKAKQIEGTYTEALSLICQILEAEPEEIIRHLEEDIRIQLRQENA